MPNDTRTPDQIERDIERERSDLASTVDALQDKFSPEAVISEIAMVASSAMPSAARPSRIRWRWPSPALAWPG